MPNFTEIPVAIIGNNGSSIARRAADAARNVAAVAMKGVWFPVTAPAPKRPEPFQIPAAIVTARVLDTAAWGAEVRIGDLHARRGRDRWYLAEREVSPHTGETLALGWRQVSVVRLADLIRMARDLAR